MLNKKLIEHYILKDSLATYDPYDIWITTIGKKVKQFYYGHKRLGVLPAGLLTIYDFYINNSKRIGYGKREYPLVRGQASLILINLYKKSGDKIYLEYAKKHIDWLLENSSKGYNGYCWGLNYDWVYSEKDTYDSNIPFSTHTPYPLEAMIKYYQVTKDETLIEPIKSVYNFFENDIKIIQENSNKLILSYGVTKDRIVLNANSYAMYCYALLLEFFPEEDSYYIKYKIYRLYNFIKFSQKSDGSWLYAPYDDDTFIDTFHSAFIMKNIFKTNEILPLDNSDTIIKNGYNYVIDNMWDKENRLFKRFSKTNRVSITKFDLYDNAEMLNLSILLKEDNMVELLTDSINKRFVKSDLEIASIIDIFGNLKNINHLGWAVVQYLYALSNLEEK